MESCRARLHHRSDGLDARADRNRCHQLALGHGAAAARAGQLPRRHVRLRRRLHHQRRAGHRLPRPRRVRAVRQRRNPGNPERRAICGAARRHVHQNHWRMGATAGWLHRLRLHVRHDHYRH